MLKEQIFRIYGRECCSLPTASLNASRVAKHTTAADRTFHWTVPSGKKRIFIEIFGSLDLTESHLMGNNEKHEGWPGYNLVWGLPQVHT